MPCSLVKLIDSCSSANQSTQCEPPFACFICTAYSSSLKMEAAGFSETMVTYLPNFMALHPRKTLIFIVTDMSTSTLS
jgi:hypothetical protein